MRIFPSFLSQRPAALLPVVVALVLFVGCDSTGGLDDNSNVTVTAEETAESIALSLAESSGGAASDFSDAAAIAGGAVASMAKDLNRSRNCSYDSDTQIWTCTVEVNGSLGRIDTVDFDREYRAQFFAEDTEVRRPADADSMTFEIVEGSGEFKTARLSRSHELLEGTTWAFRQAPDNTTYAIHLLSTEAGRNVEAEAEGRDGNRSRTREAKIRKTSVENLVLRRGVGLVEGTIEGSYEADVEIERADDSTVSRSVNLTYVATFTEDGAQITLTGGGDRFNGQTFEFNRQTGELE